SHDQRKYQGSIAGLQNTGRATTIYGRQYPVGRQFRSLFSITIKNRCMSYRSRVYRQRNPQQNEKDSKDQDKFFTMSSEKSPAAGAKNAFFQAKPNDTPGSDDALEKEANKKADAVPDRNNVKDKKDEK